MFAGCAVHDYRTPSRLVAAYCGISQTAVWAMAREGESYFTRAFRKLMGVTPREVRDARYGK